MRFPLLVLVCVLLTACDSEYKNETLTAETASESAPVLIVRTGPQVSLRFSTLLNPNPSAGFTELWEPVFDSAGNIIVAGVGDYADPRTPDNPYGDIPSIVFDATPAFEGSSFMVAKLTADGKPVWLAFLDGSGAEKEIDGLAVDSKDNIVLSGTTPNGDFPTTTGAFDTTINNGGKVNRNGDAFVAKLSAAGDRLIFSTFLGGRNGDSTSRGGIAMANDDSIYVAGHTKANDFLHNPSSGIKVPVRSKYHGGIGEGFVLQLSPDGDSVNWVTFIGSSKETIHGDVVLGVTTGPKGKPHITALVRGDDLPTTHGAYSRQYAGGVSDAYAARLDKDGHIEWASYLGGSGEDVPEHGVRVDASGNMVFAGATLSSDWPTLNADQPRYAGAGDGFLVKLDAVGQLVFSTFIGGNKEDAAIGVGVDTENRIYVGGDTNSYDFTVTDNALDPSFNGTRDVFGRIYDTNGALMYSTYFGGSDWDRCRFGTSSPDGDMILVGSTRSTDYPVSSSAFGTAHNGNFDSFITRLAITW